MTEITDDSCDNFRCAHIAEYGPRQKHLYEVVIEYEREGSFDRASCQLKATDISSAITMALDKLMAYEPTATRFTRLKAERQCLLLEEGDMCE